MGYEREWQLIETAPKDGTHMLLFTAKEGIGTGYWNQEWLACFGIEEYLNPGTIDGDPLIVRPIFWMPLPDLPP